MQHIENMVKYWSTLLQDVKELPQVLAATTKHGGTRPVWQRNDGKLEHILLAWPAESTLRSATIVSGKPDGKLDPCTIIPFMEGIANELRVEKTYAWKNKIEGSVGCAIGDADGGINGEIDQVLWFYDPLYFRDKNIDLTEGVEQSFYMSGLCLAVRPALLDEITITSGPEYEARVALWLKQNPDKTRLDAPSLKIDMRGQRILAPTPIACEYQARATIHNVESFGFGPENGQVKVYRFVVTFGQKKHLHLMMYAAAKVCQNNYEPKDGDEVDLIFWLQGRIADSSPAEEITETSQAEQNPNDQVVQ